MTAVPVAEEILARRRAFVVGTDVCTIGTDVVAARVVLARFVAVRGPGAPATTPASAATTATTGWAV